VQDGARQSAPLPTMSLENLSHIIAKATSWSWEVFTNLDRQRPPPIPQGLADFACATFGLPETSFSQREFADDTPDGRGSLAK
jgi:hypothetical protein